MRFLKDIYYTLFMLAFRIREKSWPSDYNVMKSIALVCFVECAAIVGVFVSVENRFGVNFLSGARKWMYYLFAFVLLGANGLALESRDRGRRFISSFECMDERRRVLLVVSAVLVMVASITLMVFSEVVKVRRGL